MTEAIFGLLGVIVGALVSGGIAFVMARRGEKQKTRAAARLIEEELRRMTGVLYQLRVALMRNQERDIAAALAECAAFTGDVWEKHRDWLASVLAEDEWYPVMVAFGTLKRLRDTAIQWRDEPDRPHQLTAERAGNIEGNVYGALRPMSRLAGRELPGNGAMLLGPYW